MNDREDFRPVIRSRRRATITNAKTETSKLGNGATSEVKTPEKKQESRNLQLREDNKRKCDRYDQMRCSRSFSVRTMVLYCQGQKLVNSAQEGHVTSRASICGIKQDRVMLMKIIFI